MKLINLTILIVALTFTSSCKKDTNPSENCMENISVSGRDASIVNRWILVGYKDVEDHCKPDDFPEIYVVFNTNNSFEGFSSCNQFQGGYEVLQNTIMVSDLLATKIYCSDEPRNTWEEKLTTGLLYASTFEISGKKLTIKSTKNITLVFEQK